jgi:SAM-dependent methyltransferase
MPRPPTLRPPHPGRPPFGRHTPAAAFGAPDWIAYILSMVQPDLGLLREIEEHLTAGQLDLAEALCRSGLEAGAGQPELLILLSFLRMKQGRWAEAETTLLRGAALHPRHAGLQATLGGLYLRQQRFGDAVEPFQTCVLLEPGRRDHRVALVAVYETRVFGTFAEDARQAMTACLGDDSLTHGLMSKAWLSLLRLDPHSAGVMSLFETADYETFCDRTTASLLSAWQENRFLNGGLKRFLVADPVIERGLTFTRRYLLEQWRSGGAARLDRHLPLLCVLARYAFMTEYVFATTEAYAALAGSLATPAEVALLGCYEPLFLHERSKRLASLSSERCYKDLVRVQIEEPLKEARIEASIPVLSPIVDAVSRAVREQYEENPYPRWTTVGGAAIPDAVAAAARGKHILIAGCGTGREAAEAALIFPLAEVDAVDLSRASLAHGIRRARELRIRNLTFTQADLLDIGALGERFDLIVSSGVLHHLRDPRAGLRALLEVLRPGGLLRIGLYSTIARATIAQARTLIAESGLAPSLQGIRAFRAAVLARGDDDPLKRTLIAWPDFYSTSPCRDLAFHVQEHTFTLLEIADIARDFELSVVQVDTRSLAHRVAYRERYPDDPEAIDLPSWHALEEERPTMFAGMYSLWFCRSGERQTLDVDWIRDTGRM